MNFNDYQDRTAETWGKGVDIQGPLAYLALGLNDEAGEVAGKVKKLFRDKDGIITTEVAKDIAKELGDVLWYLSRIAHEIGYDLEYVAELNIEKIMDRKDRGVIRGNGDDR